MRTIPRLCWSNELRNRNIGSVCIRQAMIMVLSSNDNHQVVMRKMRDWKDEHHVCTESNTQKPDWEYVCFCMFNTNRTTAKQMDRREENTQYKGMKAAAIFREPRLEIISLVFRISLSFNRWLLLSIVMECTIFITLTKAHTNPRWDEHSLEVSIRKPPDGRCSLLQTLHRVGPSV